MWFFSHWCIRTPVFIWHVLPFSLSESVMLMADLVNINLSAMWWNTMRWNHERTFKHASQVRRTKTHPTIFCESSMTVRRTSCSPLSPSPVLKWYKILMSALWISFSWNLAKALKVCELGDMHEKENRKMRWRQEASLMKYIPVMEEKRKKTWNAWALLWYLYVYFIVVAHCYKRFVLCIWMHWWA